MRALRNTGRSRGALWLALAVLWVGCSRSRAAEPLGPAGLELTELRHEPYAGMVTFPELAEELGYLAPIKLKYMGSTISGPASIQSVVTGDTDFGGAFHGAIIKLVAAKAPIKAVVGYYGADAETFQGFYVLEDSPIRNGRDLIGKKVALNTLGAHSEFMWREYLSREGLSEAEIKQTTQGKMDQTIAAFKNTLTKIRTGRANPGILDTVQIDYYGSMMPIGQVANVSLLDARTISVQPWEKGMGAKIEKAIRESDLGLNPASMGDLIRVPMPPMSEERRKEMTKLVHREAENAKVAIRNLRRDANEHVKKLVKDKTATEDDLKRAEGDVQKVTDKHIAEIDALVAGKEKEILEV